MTAQSHLRGLPAGPFVSPDWLAARLDDPGVVVIDTRGRVPAPGAAPASMRADFDEAHLPGAQFVDWFSDFVDVDDPVPNQLAGPARATAAAARLGIGADTVVVAYDDYHSIFAGRLWWALRAFGHDAVRVLDGGWTGWVAGGHPVSSEAVAPLGGSATGEPFVARPVEELRWMVDDVASRTPDVVLVDARSRERYAGTGGDAVGGHIPGAVNAPYVELVGEDGFLRPRAELERVFRRAGIDPAQPPARIVASCGSGISASVPLLALEVLAPGAGTRGAVYDGSWAEWSRTGRPVETGQPSLS